MLDHLSLRTDSTTTLIATLDIFITATSVNDDDDDHPSGKARAATLHILDTLHGWWVVQGQRERGVADGSGAGARGYLRSTKSLFKTIISLMAQRIL